MITNKMSDDRISRFLKKAVSLAITLSLTAGIFIFTPEKAAAAASQFDQTFGSGGKVFYSTVSGTGGGADIEIQPDGKSVVVGMNGFEVARFNVNGTPDNSFDGDGLAQVPGLSQAITLAIQPDGKILAAGQGADAPLVRFNSDGSLDSTFDGDGIALLATPTFTNEIIYDIAIQPDGKIIVGGWGGVELSNTKFIVARFNPNGTPDASFGPTGNGIITTSFGSSARLTSIALQPDGKIVAGGFDSNLNFTLIRIANGALDPTFDTDGVLTTSIRGASALIKVMIQPDGKIIAAGLTRNTTQDQDVALVRYNPDGSLDTSFDGDGIATTNDAAYDVTTAAALQPDGKIIVAERRDNNIAALIRFNSNGSLDTSFHGDGKFIFPASVYTNTSANAVAVQPDGKIIVSGGQGPDIFLSRLLGDPRAVVTNNTGIVLEDRNGTNPPFLNRSTVNVSGLPGTITKIRVSLNKINHTFPADLDIMLESPTGAHTMLMSDTGGGQAQPFVNKTIIIDQSAANLIPIPTTENSGFYKPTNLNGNTTLEPGGIDSFPSPGPGSQNYGAGNLDVFKGTNPNGQWKLYAVDDEAADTGSFDGWTLDITTTTSRINNLTSDFDGDGRADISVWRASTGSWWYLKSSDLLGRGFSFGTSTDIPVPADYTGDGKTDLAVFRPSTAQWYVQRSEDGSYAAVPFGLTGDFAVPADYDGDGIADLAVFRPSTQTWYIQQSSGGFGILTFGLDGDKPVVADYDGDGKADIATWRPSNGTWWIVHSSDLSQHGYGFGLGTDKPVVGDYTGDGKADIAVWRDATREWLFLRSEDGSYYSYPSGLPGDIPAPGDYDGDGKFDSGVFRPSTQTWYIDGTTAGSMIATFGLNGDRPVANAFVP